MKKSVNMKTVIPVMAVVLILLIVLKASGLLTINSGTRFGFVGNDGFHKYNGHYSKISGMFSHTIRPSKDSKVVHCEITTKSGTLHVEIVQKKDEKVLIDKEISGDETFDVEAEGKVLVKLNTEGHSGSYLFEY